MAENKSDQKKVILIVDDEPDLRMMFKDILSTFGYETDEAEDGKVCLEKMEKNKYDLVLLDLMMPRVDGMEALTQIKGHPETYGEAPILILTNLTSDVAIKEGFERKADGYLIKTELTPEQVIEEIESALTKKRSNKSHNK